MTPFNPMMMRQGFHPMMTGTPTNGPRFQPPMGGYDSSGINPGGMYTGGQMQPQPMPAPMMGGSLPPQSMPQMHTGGYDAPQQMPGMRMGGPMQPQGGYDGSGINPHGMYTGGPQRPMGGREFGPRGFNLFGRRPGEHFGGRP